LHIVKDRNNRTNSHYMQLILDTQRAPVAGGEAICRSLKENNADKRR